MLAAADRLEGIQGSGVTGDQGVEEMPQGSQGLVLGRAVAGELVDEAAGEARGDLGEIKALILAPGEEAPPASDSFRIPMICSSLNRFRFMVSPPGLPENSLSKWTLFRGIGQNETYD